MKSNTLKVAVTGNIGSGKSAFCDYISSKGFLVIKADDLAEEILLNDEKVKKEIIKSFGEKSYKNGIPDKVFLSNNVFSDPLKLLKINSIIHPVVFLKLEEIFIKNVDRKIIFVEAALIYEANMEEMFDLVVLISSSENNRKKRKIESGQLSSEEFDKRNNSQIPEVEKKKRADFIFENNSTLDELKKKADLMLVMISGKIDG